MAEYDATPTRTNFQGFEPYQDLIAQETTLTPEVSVDSTVRVKILDRCGMACNFCHNEGTPIASSVGFQALRVSIYTPDNGIAFRQADVEAAHADEFGEVLTRLREAGLADELHWTGGEPTLSTALPTLTGVGREAGYSVKITSNGQSGSRRLAELAKAGLTGVNFSIFGTTPEELAETQRPVFRNNLGLAARRLVKMDEAMKAAIDAGLKVKANVVINGYESIPRGLRLLDRTPEGAHIRFQADTTRREESLGAIYELMNILGAVPVAREIVAGCSIDNYEYELPNGRCVTFKQTRQSRLPEICNDCSVDAAGNCHEGYYGIRLYRDDEGEYWLSGCIQRMDTAQRLDDFLGDNGQGAAIKTYRENDLPRIRSEHGL